MISRASEGHGVREMNLASYLIKGEINRFECVHPYIYASYDILDGMRDVELSNRIRDHLISIEDAFVHSQEWTLSRDVSEIKIVMLMIMRSVYFRLFLDHQAVGSQA